MAKKLKQEEYIKRCNIIHNNKYDYSKTVYKNSRTNVTIVCKIHGEFSQDPRSHITGKGCYKCGYKLGREKASLTNRRSRAEFIEEVKKLYGDKYDYSHIPEKPRRHSKYEIICKDHGVFVQRLKDHLAGHGCTACNAPKFVPKNYELRIEQFKQTHGDLYDYSLINKNYGSHEKIPIICKKHGLFHQNLNNHKNGSICPTCSETASTSKGEKEWLDSLGLPNTPSHRQVPKKIGGVTYRFDGYDPNTNTVYEYHGDYWHGNPKIYNPDDKNAYNGKTMLELFNRTVKRSRIIRDSGYNLISIWESEWKATGSK